MAGRLFSFSAPPLPSPRPSAPSPLVRRRHETSLAIHSLAALAARFEDSYASDSACFSVSRLRLFAAIAYLKLAYVEAVVRRNRDGKHVVDALLEEAGRFAESEN